MFRENTIDPIIWASQLLRNEYDLPQWFASEDMVIDVGAHIGAFALAALERGVGHIYCVEPDRENAQIAQRNLAPYLDEGSVTLIQAAVWRSDPNEDELRFDGYPVFDGGMINTGGGNVLWRTDGPRVDSIALDQVIQTLTLNRDRVRLLKVDCEGAEWPILLTARTLDRVDEIRGEYHEFGGAYDEHDAPFALPGFSSFTRKTLTEFLTLQGYEVWSSRHRSIDGKPQPRGLFFAVRP